MVSKIQEIKAEVIAEKNKTQSAVQAILGSRALLALLTILMIAFGAQTLYAPARLPPLAGIDIARTFLPQVDAGLVGQKLEEARQAALRQGGLDRLNDFITSHQNDIPLFNLIGFIGSALLLVGNLLFAASKWKSATGVVIGAP